MVMSQMVQAGRLQHVPNHPSLVRMGGVVRQLEDQRTIDVSLHDQDGHENQEEDDSIINDKAGHSCITSIRESLQWAMACQGYCMRQKRR